MIATNNMIARVAAVVAGLGLVASSFVAFAPSAKAQSSADLQAQIQALLAQIAALQAQAGTGASASAGTTFTRDLTIGSTGSDVTALQNWLISKGFTIAAGATGYFGAQTQAALAKYQASVGITPAAGYFGPITRAKVNAGAGTGTGTGTGTGSSDLSGGEADLTDFEFNSEESSGDEGEEEVEVGTAEFDVEDGDVRVERIEIMASSTDTTLETNPWDYFTRVSILVDGEEVAEMDVDDRDAWDDEDSAISTDDVYRLTVTGVDAVFEEGDRAEITVAFDIADNIDTADLAQDFAIQIPDDGIRAVDSEGIQHYIGAADDLGDDASPDESVTFGFNAEESGDLQISTSSEDPESDTLIADDTEESDEYTVFVFEIENEDEADALITDLTIDAATTSATFTNMVRDVTLSVDGEEYDGDVTATGADATIDFEDIDVQIDGEDTLEFTVMVTLKANASNGTVTFSIDSADVTAEGVDSGDNSTVSGSADGNTHTVAQTGIVATGVSDDADANDDSTVGTFTLTFEVEALEDDVYIFNAAPEAATSTAGGVTYNIYQSGTLINGTTTDSALLQSDADTSGSYFIVREGQTEEFTLTVTVSPEGTNSSALYYIELDEIYFDTAADGLSDDTVYNVPNESEFETNAVSLT